MERIAYAGIDGFNRPVFKSLDRPRRFYGDTDTLFSYGATESEVLAKVDASMLSYFGSRFDCEPCGGPAPDDIVIVTKITQKLYDRMLEVLPPAYWEGDTFQLGEPYDHDAQGRPRYGTYTKIKGEYYSMGIMTTERARTIKLTNE